MMLAPRSALALTASFALLAPGAALAHPGHGVVTEPVLHLLAEPLHALPIAAALALGVGLLFARRASSQARSRAKARTKTR